jgi:hypothetical protein
MSPGSPSEKKGIGRDIRVERKNNFESLVNGGGERSGPFIVPSAKSYMEITNQ